MHKDDVETLIKPLDVSFCVSGEKDCSNLDFMLAAGDLKTRKHLPLNLHSYTHISSINCRKCPKVT